LARFEDPAKPLSSSLINFIQLQYTLQTGKVGDMIQGESDNVSHIQDALEDYISHLCKGTSSECPSCSCRFQARGWSDLQVQILEGARYYCCKLASIPVVRQADFQIVGCPFRYAHPTRLTLS
jgi:hypothetical protein